MKNNKKSNIEMERNFLVYVFDYVRVNYGFSNEVSLFIACQAALESHFGRSRLALQCRNLFGMRFPKLRFTLAYGSDEKGWARYKDYGSSISDYVIRNAYFGLSQIVLESVEEYSRFLIRTNYCPEETYIDRIMSLYYSFVGEFDK